MFSGRRIVALGVIALTLALAYGIWYSYSVILVALLAEFGWSRSVLAGAFSVFTLVHGGVNPLIGALCARFRPLRVIAAGGAARGIALFLDSFISSPAGLYLGFGVATAAAVALGGWVPSLVFVQRNFQERLGLSVGIISSGVGVGMLLVVPLTQLLIDAFGWRAAFRVLGVIAVVWIIPSSLWLRHVMLTQASENRGQTPTNQNQERPGARGDRGGVGGGGGGAREHRGEDRRRVALGPRRARGGVRRRHRDPGGERVRIAFLENGIFRVAGVRLLSAARDRLLGHRGDHAGDRGRPL